MRFLHWLKNLFSKKAAGVEAPDHQKLSKAWFDRKSAFMEKVLGKEHGMVMHAFVPYAIGGNLALFSFPNGIAGTAIVTKELCELPNQGPSNALFGSYEFVMFTKHPLSLDDAKNEATPFGRAHLNIDAILNVMARYSQTAKLNPFETAEFPADMEKVGSKCLIFVPYARHSDDLAKNFGLLAIIEVFRSEIEYAMKQGGQNLIKMLKEKGFFPYSDLDREPAV
jgi:hypothetical protein